MIFGKARATGSMANRFYSRLRTVAIGTPSGVANPV